MNTSNPDTTISFNVGKDVKGKLKEMAANYGLTISDLMRMSAIQTVEKGISIEPSYEPSAHLAAAIKSAEEEHEAGSTTTVKSPADLKNHFANLKR